MSAEEDKEKGRPKIIKKSFDEEQSGKARKSKPRGVKEEGD